MSTTGESSPEESQRVAVGADDSASVTAHRSSPDRVVFVETGNSDAWIATDLTVDPRR